MNVIINDKQKIAAVQKEFNKHFPFLKLEFYSRLHRIGKGSAKGVIADSTTFGECRKTAAKGILTISPEMTVADLEQAFGNTYGLGVQVFRKSGKVWLQTTITDEWTLEKQNKEGQELCKAC
jgi:hypothetical protein